MFGESLLALLAGNCRIERIKGYAGACDPENIARQEQ
ncbi:hypothetical protein BH18ACT10_BH18ACT10_13040 [soil metagenome]